MKYIDRNGKITTEENGQDQLLQWLYTHRTGRLLIRLLIKPPVSRAAGRFLDTAASRILIGPSRKAMGISLKECEKKRFHSYNDFFTRRLRKECRPLPEDETVLISPCDGKLSVYPIDRNRRFRIKNTEYSLESLLRSRSLAERYRGGYACVFRLTVDDYHRYCYVDNGICSRPVRIPGVFHTVNPAANDVCPIYKENTREYSLLKSEHFDTVLMMEVGALMVGRIVNHNEAGAVRRGQEKGRFEFGGSTVILLFRKNAVAMDEDLLRNTGLGYETIVKMGEHLGTVYQKANVR